MGGVLEPSICSLFTRCAGSCEKMHVFPARQLPATQYLGRCVRFHPISGDSGG